MLLQKMQKRYKKGGEKGARTGQKVCKKGAEMSRKRGEEGARTGQKRRRKR